MGKYRNLVVIWGHPKPKLCLQLNNIQWQLKQICTPEVYAKWLAKEVGESKRNRPISLENKDYESKAEIFRWLSKAGPQSIQSPFCINGLHRTTHLSWLIFVITAVIQPNWQILEEHPRKRGQTTCAKTPCRREIMWCGLRHNTGSRPRKCKKK